MARPTVVKPDSGMQSARPCESVACQPTRRVLRSVDRGHRPRPVDRDMFAPVRAALPCGIDNVVTALRLSHSGPATPPPEFSRPITTNASPDHGCGQQCRHRGTHAHVPADQEAVRTAPCSFPADLRHFYTTNMGAVPQCPKPFRLGDPHRATFAARATPLPAQRLLQNEKRGLPISARACGTSFGFGAVSRCRSEWRARVTLAPTRRVKAYFFKQRHIIYAIRGNSFQSKVGPASPATMSSTQILRD